MTPATSPARGPRPGFSLIELLVVIAILGVLAALITAAVQRAREYGDSTRIRADISNLDNGVSEFKRAMKVNRLPAFGQMGPFGDPQSKFRLRKVYRNTANNDVGTAADPGPQSAEAQFLKTMFPNMLLDPVSQRAVAGGAGEADKQHGTGLPNLDLTPNQALVFFLGGYYLHVDTSSTGTVSTNRRQVWLQGYLTDPRTPFRFDAPLANQPTGKKNQFFEFKPEQLDLDFALLDPPSGTPELLDRNHPDTTGKFRLAPSYLDTYGTPYLYLSTTSANGNDYYAGWTNANGANPFYDPTNAANPNNGYDADPNPSDPLVGFTYFAKPDRGDIKKVKVENGAFGNSTKAKFNPFKVAQNRFVNEKTHQIASAGKDKVFGPGGPYKAATSDAYAEGRVGGDDYTNFTTGKMAGAQ